MRAWLVVRVMAPGFLHRLWALLMCGAPVLAVTFDLVPPLAWDRPYSPVQSVNDPGGMSGTVWLEERLPVCERLLRWNCGLGGGVVECAFWVVLHCLRTCFRWSVKISCLLEEQDDAVVGVFQLPVHWVYIHFRCHTPAADVTEWEWLVISYLMDVFHVVYKVICVPPPVLHLN